MKIKNFKDDTQEEINKCLECKKPECTNCLYYIEAVKSKSELIHERNEEIMRLFYGGFTGIQISRIVKIDQSTVNRIIKVNGGRNK